MFPRPGDRSVDRSMLSMEDQVIDHDVISMDQDENSLGEGGRGRGRHPGEGGGRYLRKGCT